MARLSLATLRFNRSGSCRCAPRKDIALHVDTAVDRGSTKWAYRSNRRVNIISKSLPRKEGEEAVEHLWPPIERMVLDEDSLDDVEMALCFGKNGGLGTLDIKLQKIDSTERLKDIGEVDHFDGNWLSNRVVLRTQPTSITTLREEDRPR